MVELHLGDSTNSPAATPAALHTRVAETLKLPHVTQAFSAPCSLGLLLPFSFRGLRALSGPRGSARA